VSRHILCNRFFFKFFMSGACSISREMCALFNELLLEIGEMNFFSRECKNVRVLKKNSVESSALSPRSTKIRAKTERRETEKKRRKKKNNENLKLVPFTALLSKRYSQSAHSVCNGRTSFYSILLLLPILFLFSHSSSFYSLLMIWSSENNDPPQKKSRTTPILILREHVTLVRHLPSLVAAKDEQREQQQQQQQEQHL